MNNKHFPNGFASWQKTHFEVVCAINEHLNNPNSIPAQRHENYDSLYDLAEEWTDELEGLLVRVETAEESFDLLDRFLKERMYFKTGKEVSAESNSK